ncbi:hypothetical protein NA57DRAFT_69274 [Rhizodiscina lignyota]|uniref:P-loop containing nucleoside triphosphate hydrolase protein n=1 Tax=Rhizodiscina lignyota TaxID=1504668 RepID=A0A9P4I587_9PEZI|nr:hypothetical protein NA57DRAFT_69274 [Rhizodiscina lignyota]
MDLYISDILYPQQPAPPRVRTKPMQILCVGPPRSGTESLATALRLLGYEVYHGWDLIFEQPSRIRQWTLLARQKFSASSPVKGDSKITTAQFDELMGHAEAVVDSAAWTFAAELIEAYPDAKVILNTRHDQDAWHSSIQKVFLPICKSWPLWFLSRLDPYHFWLRTFYVRWTWPMLFRSEGDNPASGIENCGKWVYREHCAMVKGLLASRGEQGRLLEWDLGDGWQPLCEFLGRDVPNESFPRTNSAGDFGERERRIVKHSMMVAARNGAIASGTDRAMSSPQLRNLQLYGFKVY